MTKFDPQLFFNPLWENNFDPLTSYLDTPPPTKNLDPHLHFDNSITGNMQGVVKGLHPIVPMATKP